MFVRKKKHRSGHIGVIVVDKSNGKFREIKSFGVAKTDAEADALCLEANKWIRTYGGQQEINFTEPDIKQNEEEETERVLSNIDSLLLNGHQIILNQVYDSIGFNQIQDSILRHLVIARISQPMSKHVTVDYLKSYFDEDVELYKLYRYMDKLYDTQKEEVQRISVEHTKRILGGHVGLMFYDVTTLYFETGRTDVLRESGFSKDGKTSESQIVLGLLVSRDGYPLSYCIFNGSQYEGYTMLPIIDDFIQRFSLDDFVVVADAGLMSKRNVKLLEDAGYKYIIGARIHTESEQIKEWILQQDKMPGKFHEYRYGDNARLILGYSVERAFRVTKGNLEARPIFHFTEKRIEAHICICFIAYEVYKELERILKIAKINKSVDSVLKIAKTIATIRINMPNNGKVRQETLLLTPAQHSIKPLFDIQKILDGGKSGDSAHEK